MAASAAAPVRILTFLFCDIQGSTALLGKVGESDYGVLIEGFRTIMREAVAKHSGVEIGLEGDGYFATFDRPSDALAAARDCQIAIASRDWPGAQKLLVRMGVHTGEASEMAGTLVGMGLHVGARVMSAAHGGQVLVSEAAATLAHSDGLKPLGKFHMKDVAQPLELYQLDIGTTSEFPPPRTLDTRSHNLSDHVTSFIGRDKELMELKELLREKRLVTLIGPGGIGKTRLAVEASLSLIDRFEDGIWLIELSSIQDPGLVASAIADALRMPLGSHEVSTLIGDSSMLLVLDNSEHLIPSVTETASEILAQCPRARILATSRQPLGVVGEQVYEVAPLSLDDRDASGAEAVRLFLERAVENDPSFEVDKRDRTVLIDICKSLDCMPLALELAASKLRTMGLSELRTGLGERMKMLGESSGVARNLRSVLDWSFDALDEHEKALLRRLSVFAGPFSVASAGAVCGWSPLTPEVGSSLERLVLRSLVQRQTTGQTTTYRLLETVREYAEEKLLESKETSRTTLAYVDHFASQIDLKGLRSSRRDPGEMFEEHEIATSRTWRVRGILQAAEMILTGIGFLVAFILQVPARFSGELFSSAPLLRYWLAIVVAASVAEILSLPMSAWYWLKIRPVIENKPFQIFRFIWDKFTNILAASAFIGAPSFVIWLGARSTPWWWVWGAVGLPFLFAGTFRLAMRTIKRPDVTDPKIRAEVNELARRAGKKVASIVQSKPSVSRPMRELPTVICGPTSNKALRVFLNKAALEAEPGVRRALIAQELASTMGKRAGGRWRSLRRFIMLVAFVAPVLGSIAFVISSPWALRLGGIESLHIGDAAPLVASVMFMASLVAALLISWTHRNRAFRRDLIAAAITREPEAFAASLREAMVQTKSDLSPLRFVGLKANPVARIAVVSEWEKAQRTS